MIGKSIARLIRRNSSDDEDDGLLIGAVMRQGNSFIKKGYVYELQTSILDPEGPPQLVQIGPSWVPQVSPSDISWGNSVDHLLFVGGKHITLTQNEYNEYLKTPQGRR